MSHLDGLPDDEWVDEDADEGDERDDLAECPNCKAEIYAGADRCPKCGEYAMAHRAQEGGLPWWMWIGILLAATVLLWWLTS